MKIRVFQAIDNAVFRVIVFTEDWSEGDIKLMEEFGEPEVDVGGEVQYSFDGEPKSKIFGNELVRVLHGFPYSRGFDSRDYCSVEEAVAIGREWKERVISLISDAVLSLRQNEGPFPTEEVYCVYSRGDCHAAESK